MRKKDGVKLTKHNGFFIAGVACVALVGMGLFEHFYNKISDEMPAYLSSLEQLHD